MIVFMFSGLLVEQSERSLNSPVSHVSSASRHSRHQHRTQHKGGLTSENVARFNSGNASHGHFGHTNNGNSSTLVNTLDLVSVGSESRKKANFPNSVNGKDQTAINSSSSSDSEDDSFTCSEFECDSNTGAPGGCGKDLSDASAGHPRSASGGGMVFNKLATNR